ncbi:MAG: glycosyltransferase family 4 protein [Janthinobacterium lividum]
MIELVFFVPPSPDTAGGGSAYNRHLIAALRELGCGVATVVIENEAQAHEGWDGLAGMAAGVIDGMVLPCFDAGPDRRPWLDGRAAALVHHPTALADPARRDLIRAAECRILPHLACVVATSAGVGARLVAEFGAQPACVHVVEPGLGRFARTTGAGDGPCHVLSVGRLAPRKGHDVLLHALARLADLDWRLTIAGDGHGDAAWADGLGTLAAALGVADRVRLIEHPSDTELAGLWGSADLFALASRRETTGAAMAEALRRGIPVAVTGCGTLPPEAGTSCLPGDGAGLSRCLRRMICDDGLRRSMAEAAWAAGQCLPAWPTQAARFLDALAAARQPVA